MQYQLPFFPTNTKLINGTLGFREQDGTVHYLHNGNPIYSHLTSDLNGYRFIIANLVEHELCTIAELSTALGIARRNIERYAKTLRDHGSSYFFKRKETRGQCHKLTPEKMLSAQADLDAGCSQYRTARNVGVSDAAIAYHINNGNLKKNNLKK
jgi:biotin operon repressor